MSNGMLSEIAKSPFPYSLCRWIGLYVLLAIFAVAATGFIAFYFGVGPELTQRFDRTELTILSADQKSKTSVPGTDPLLAISSGKFVA